MGNFYGKTHTQTYTKIYRKQKKMHHVSRCNSKADSVFSVTALLERLFQSTMVLVKYEYLKQLLGGLSGVTVSVYRRFSLSAASSLNELNPLEQNFRKTKIWLTGPNATV